MGSTEVAVAALAPAIENVDEFMQYVFQELKSEKTEAERIHQERLEWLEKEEALYIQGNDSPSQNRYFKKVQDDIAALKHLIEQQAGKHTSQMSLNESWDSMMKALPAKEPMELDPPRQGFWRRLTYFTRGSATTSARACGGRHMALQQNNEEVW